MQIALSVIDNFFPDAAQVRAFALEHDFNAANEMDGHKYPGTARFRHPSFRRISPG